MRRTCPPFALAVLFVPALILPSPAQQTGRRPDPKSPGYRWLNPRDPKDFRTVWTPGSRDPKNPNLRAAREKGVWHPDPGYAWLTNDKKDLRVRWVPGSRDPGLPNVLAGKKEGAWLPASGYQWASSAPKDLRVVKAPASKAAASLPATARAADEAKQRAVGKIVGAFLLHAGGSGKTDDAGVAVMKALALRLRDDLVEGAIKDFDPALKDYEVRAARRVICLLLEERLTVKSLGTLQVREELILELKKADSKLGAAADLADFIASVNQAWRSKGR